MKTNFKIKTSKVIEVEETIECPKGYFIIEKDCKLIKGDKYYNVNSKKWLNCEPSIGKNKSLYPKYTFCRKIKQTPFLDLLKKQYVGKTCFYKDDEYKIINIFHSKFSYFTICEITSSRTKYNIQVNISYINIPEES
jgi:hypothetical protein